MTGRDRRVAEVLSLSPGPGNPRNSEGDIAVLQDGRLLLVYSHFTDGWQDNAAAHLACRYSEDGGQTWGADGVFLPRDEGRTWEHRKVLEDDPEGWFCYISCTFAGDHALLTYCAGGPDVGSLNRLRVVRVPLNWFTA